MPISAMMSFTLAVFCRRFLISVCIFELFCFFFFFQAEDGIRDVAVTGVQTCALPISYSSTPSEYTSERVSMSRLFRLACSGDMYSGVPTMAPIPVISVLSVNVCPAARSEERRVGKECRARWSRSHEKKNIKD